VSSLVAVAALPSSSLIDPLRAVTTQIVTDQATGFTTSVTVPEVGTSAWNRHPTSSWARQLVKLTLPDGQSIVRNFAAGCYRPRELRA
jgi:hypothetical protein